MASLRDALAFISSMYGTPSKLCYYQALGTSTSLYPLESTLESTLQASYPTLTCITTPLYQLLQAYLLQTHLPTLHNPHAKHCLQTQSFWYGLGLVACCALVIALPFCKLQAYLLQTHLPTLHNPHAKHCLQTQSFWYGLGLVACCALVIALPFCKLMYASHLDTRTKHLSTHNAQLSQTIQAQSLTIQAQSLNATKLPHLSSQITDTIHNLYTIKSRYISRLEILATLSHIARNSESWITHLALQGNLDKGEALLELSCQAQNQSNLHTLMQSLQDMPKLEIIATQDDEDLSDVFGTKITLKISYA